MLPEQHWQHAAREALSQSETQLDETAVFVAAAAIEQGTRRLAALAATRTATWGLLVALALLVCAYGWMRAESRWTELTTLAHGGPWIP